MNQNTKPARAAAVVILAAGKGTRMRSARPKMLHEIAGAPLVHHAIRSAGSVSPDRLVLVVGHGAEAVADAARAAAPDIATCIQAEQLGTGHAALMAAPALAGFSGDLYVMFGDTPFIRSETFRAMAAARAAGAGLVVLGFEAADPGRYGRLVTGPDGALERIVEAKDATGAELAVTACNSGVMAGDAETMLRMLGTLGTGNAQGEYYLTDLVALSRAEGLSCQVVFCDEAETMGVNDRVELARAEAAFQARARRTAMLGGATLVAPETVWFSHDTRLAGDVVVEPHVIFGPGVSAGEGAWIGGYTHLAETRIGPGARVGPFARLRGGVDIGANCRVGNFVEIKNSNLAEGAKAAHLSYLGDAELGAGANIGAGTITCNYDGVDKHKTAIGPGAFIGSNTALIAPVAVGAGAYVATGTVVTEDVPDDALAIAREKQVNRPGYAARLRQIFARRKAAKKE